jgi:lactoylglutathione lyase
MKQKIGYVALLVRGYDEAIEFFTKTLRFTLVEDRSMGNGKRWILVAPPNSPESCSVLLAKASTPEQESRIGNQAGGRVFFFLQTDDFWRDYHDMKTRGVKFNEEPRQESYGTVVVFEDLYGNKWDLLEVNKPRSGAA